MSELVARGGWVSGVQSAKPGGGCPDRASSIQAEQTETAANSADQEYLDYRIRNRQPSEKGDDSGAGNEVDCPGGHEGRVGQFGRPIRQAWCQFSCLPRPAPATASPTLVRKPLNSQLTEPDVTETHLCFSLISFWRPRNFMIGRSILFSNTRPEW